MLPGMDGFAVCKQLREKNARMGIIMLTARTQESEKVQGLRLGADDYVTKPFSPSELVARVESLLRRVSAVVPAEEKITLGEITMDLREHTVTKSGVPVDLARVEFQMLHYFFTNPNVVLSRADILKKVWGEEFSGEEKIVDVNMKKQVEKSFIEYSMSVIVARALPDVRDGLKPGQRRVLYAMYEDHLTHDKPFRKSATTVGNVLGRYHPHGDASVYGTMVRMAQSFSLRYPLVEGHGNFGSVDGDPPAAYRYTEARLAKISEEMMRDIEKNVVKFVPNFDNRLREPSVLPSRIPNLLVNGSVGIAVGMATNIPPHNLGEVIDATLYRMDHPDCTVEELMQYVKGPDFPTKGIIYGNAGLMGIIRQGYHKVIYGHG
jgi:hypothetical protein